MKLNLVISFLFLLFFAPTFAKDVVIKEVNNIPVSEREAIVILPGFGSLYHSSKNQIETFKNQGYDLYIPDYIERKSIEKCVATFDKFYKKQNLKAYKKVHVFAYIIGSWTINKWLEKNTENNISSIVYDRSPPQERAPKILVAKYTLLTRLVFGKLMKDLANMPYPSQTNKKIKCGILIENKATKLIWKNKKEMEALGPLNWNVESFNQPYSDYAYMWLNHDDLYTSVDKIGNEILYFFKESKFTLQAPKKLIEQDPFKDYKK